MNAAHKYPVYVPPISPSCGLISPKAWVVSLGEILEGLGSPHEFLKNAINSCWVQRTQIISLTCPPAGCSASCLWFCVLGTSGSLLCPHSHISIQASRGCCDPTNEEVPRVLNKLLSTQLYGDFMERFRDTRCELLCVCRSMRAYVEAGGHP